MKKKVKKIPRWIYWTPRILSILFLVFLAVFSLDIFEGNYGFWGTIIGLFMHNIPVLILLVILIISWKREIVGGIAFILAGFLYIVMMLRNVISTGFEWYYLLWAVQISGIAFLIGILFIVNWVLKRKNLKRKK